MLMNSLSLCLPLYLFLQVNAYKLPVFFSVLAFGLMLSMITGQSISLRHDKHFILYLTAKARCVGII